MWNLITNSTQPPPLFPERDIKPFQRAPVFPKGFWSNASSTTDLDSSSSMPVTALGLAWAESEEGERYMLKASRALAAATSSSPFNLDRGMLTEGSEGDKGGVVTSSLPTMAAAGSNDHQFVKNAVAAGRRLLQTIDDAVLYSDTFPRELVISHALLQQKKVGKKRSAKEALLGAGNRSGKGGGPDGGKKRDRSDSMAASEVSVGAGELEQGSALALLKMNNQLGEGGDDELDDNEDEDGGFEDGLEEDDEGDEGEDFNDYAQDNNDDDDDGGDEGGDG
jgi:hypothetical protein